MAIKFDSAPTGTIEVRFQIRNNATPSGRTRYDWAILNLEGDPVDESGEYFDSFEQAVADMERYFTPLANTPKEN